MLKKYEVGAGEEFVGVYYAENEESAIKEAKSDFHWQDGKQVHLRDLGIPAKDLMYNMFAREV